MKNILYLCILLFSSPVMSQTTIVLQPDATEGKDAKVFNIGSLQNYGSDIDFIAATWTFSGEPGTLRSMIQFDLSSIPAGAGIVDARLSLYYNFVSSSSGQAGNNAAYLRRITENWDENTVSWNTQPAFTNVNQVLLPESTSSDQDYENINVAPLIRDMLADPSHSFGFMFMGVEEAVLSSMKFFSSDASQPTQRPRLEITYITSPVECLTLQPGNEGKDAKVFSLESESNFADDQDLIAAAWTFNGTPGILRSFIEFDLSGVPQNTEVLSAALSLYYNNTSSSEGQDGLNSALLQRVIEPWSEQTISWGNQPATINTNEVILPTSSSMNQDYTNIDVTRLITDMLADPGNSHGMSLRLVTEETFRSMKFATSDFDDPSRHPKLEICYTTTTSNHEIPFKEINIQPNPFQGSFLIRDLIGKYILSITDINGKVIYNTEVESNGHIEMDRLENIPSGIYFIRAFGESGNYFTKIVKAN